MFDYGLWLKKEPTKYAWPHICAHACIQLYSCRCGRGREGWQSKFSCVEFQISKMIKNHKSVLDKITVYGFNLPIRKSPEPAQMQGHTSRGHPGVYFITEQQRSKVQLCRKPCYRRFSYKDGHFTFIIYTRSMYSQ